jgi:hypothetical protein
MGAEVKRAAQAILAVSKRLSVRLSEKRHHGRVFGEVISGRRAQPDGPPFAHHGIPRAMPF